MAYSNSFRVDILAIFLFSTILFSFASNTSYESFAISNDVEIKSGNEVTYVTKISVDHSINLSETMSLSSSERKKDLGSIKIDDQKNIKSITIEEGLNFSSDISQHESSIILIKQISDRKGMIERIITNDRIRYQDKLSNKNYFDNNLESIYSDYSLQSKIQENPINFLTNLLLDENFISNNFGIFSIEIPIYNVSIESFIDSILQLKSTSNSFDSNEYSGIFFLALISGIILIEYKRRRENEREKVSIIEPLRLLRVKMEKFYGPLFYNRNKFHVGDREVTKRGFIARAPKFLASLETSDILKTLGDISAKR